MGHDISLESIITLTDAAIEHIRQKIEQQQAAGFRLSVKTSGCSGLSYVPEIIKEKQAGDVYFEEAGVAIYIDPACIDWVRGTELDYVSKGLGQSILVFNNPRAESTCGCGESFNVKTDDD